MMNKKTPLYTCCVYSGVSRKVIQYSANNIPPGGFRLQRIIDIIQIEDAPVWLAPHRGVADPNPKIKVGTVIIHCPAEKRKDKI